MSHSPLERTARTFLENDPAMARVRASVSDTNLVEVMFGFAMDRFGENIMGSNPANGTIHIAGSRSPQEPLVFFIALGDCEHGVTEAMAMPYLLSQDRDVGYRVMAYKKCHPDCEVITLLASIKQLRQFSGEAQKDFNMLLDGRERHDSRVEAGQKET